MILPTPSIEDSITAEDVRNPLRRTQIGKSVPGGSAPASVWKACQEQLEMRLTELANSFLRWMCCSP